MKLVSIIQQLMCPVDLIMTLYILTPALRVDMKRGVIRMSVVSNAAPQVDPRGGIVDVDLIDKPRASGVYEARGCQRPRMC